MTNSGIKSSTTELGKKVSAIILLLVLFAKVLFTVVSLNIGFDLTDEGVCLLWYAYPDKDPNPFYYFHKIVLNMFPFIKWDIISTRLLKVLSELTVLAMVVALLYDNLQERFKGLWNALMLIAISGLGYFALVYARVFFEGDMSYLFVLLAWAVPITFLKEHRRRYLWLAVVFSGCVIGLQFFNKFSASLLSFLMVVALLGYFAKRISYQLLLLVGVCFGVAFFFVLTGYKPSVWYQEYLDGYKYVLAGLEYDPIALLLFYLVDGSVLLLLAVAPLVAFVILRYIGKYLGKWQYPDAVFTILLLLSYVASYILLPDAYSDARYRTQDLLLNYWYSPLVSLVLYVLFMKQAKLTDRSKHVNALLILLLLSPLVSLAGTGSSLTMSAASYIIPWFGILAFLFVRYYTSTLLPALYFVTIIVAAGFSYFQVLSPFRYAQPFVAQTELIKGPREAIYVDIEQANFVTDIKVALDDADIPSGYPMVALHNLPGLVYLLDGYSPATPWYFEVGWLNDTVLTNNVARANCLNISRIKDLESRPPIFLINERELELVKPCLEEHNYILNGDSYSVKTVYNPYVAMENDALGLDKSDSLLVFIPVYR